MILGSSEDISLVAGSLNVRPERGKKEERLMFANDTAVHRGVGP
jgi:hypothetical protein